MPGYYAAGQMLPRGRPAWPQQSAPYTSYGPQPPMSSGPGRGRGNQPSNSGGRGMGGNRGRGGGPRRNIPPQQTGAAPEQMGVAPDLTLDTLSQFPYEQQKLLLGERLYPLIHKLQPTRAGKITGMLLDSGWSVEDLLGLVNDDEKLLGKVDEAVGVLDRHANQADEQGVEQLQHQQAQQQTQPLGEVPTSNGQ